MGTGFMNSQKKRRVKRIDETTNRGRIWVYERV
jgi:hypothetical protein